MSSLKDVLRERGLLRRIALPTAVDVLTGLQPDAPMGPGTRRPWHRDPRARFPPDPSAD